GGWYRAIFVDVEKVAAALPVPAPDDRILDVGGGDGLILDRYLDRHPQARAVMIDQSAQIGSALSATVRSRVELLPGTSLADYARLGRPAPTLVLVSDVVHHIPAADRSYFFAEIRSVIGDGRARLVVKDVEPGSLRSMVAWAADRFVSGD